MARAVFSLDAQSRWAVTGTPIQNRLSDLASLLTFIRVYPYSDPKQFESDISHLWKSGKDEEAVKRLQCLSACLLLRRPAHTISLPPRRDTQCPIDFSNEERALYEDMSQQTIIKIGDALHHDFESSRSGVYVNILQRINSMRLVCNLGLHYHKRHNETFHLSETTEWPKIAQQTLNTRREMGPINCSQCSSTLELTETLLEESHTLKQRSQFSRCLKFICADCTDKICLVRGSFNCGCNPSCPVASVSTSSSVLEEVTGPVPTFEETSSIGLPSKLEALVADLRSQPSHVEWLATNGLIY